MPTAVGNTIAYLKACQAARAAGHPVAYTTDPAWLLDFAIDRRAGWLEDAHSRDICQPVGGKTPRACRGDAQRHLAQLSHRFNTPRLIVRRSELGAWGTYLARRVPDRITFPEDECAPPTS